MSRAYNSIWQNVGHALYWIKNIHFRTYGNVTCIRKEWVVIILLFMQCEFNQISFGWYTALIAKGHDVVIPTFSILPNVAWYVICFSSIKSSIEAALHFEIKASSSSKKNFGHLTDWARLGSPEKAKSVESLIGNMEIDTKS